MMATNLDGFLGSKGYRAHGGQVSSKWQKVYVRAFNVARLLTEFVTKKDEVTLKIDVEGAEVEILDCLQSSPARKLINTLIIEDHWQMLNNDKEKTRARNVVRNVIDQWKKEGMHVIEWH